MEAIQAAASLARAVRARRAELLSSLTGVETRATAEIELRWLLAGLEAAPRSVGGWRTAGPSAARGPRF